MSLQIFSNNWSLIISSTTNISRFWCGKLIKSWCRSMASKYFTYLLFSPYALVFQASKCGKFEITIMTAHTNFDIIPNFINVRSLFNTYHWRSLIWGYLCLSWFFFINTYIIHSKQCNRWNITSSLTRLVEPGGSKVGASSSSRLHSCAYIELYFGSSSAFSNTCWKGHNSKYTKCILKYYICINTQYSMTRDN